MKLNLTQRARVYFIAVIMAGIFVLAWTLWRWESGNLKRFAAYLILASVAGALKVRIPKIEGTYSLTFLFILIGIVDLSLSETVLIAMVSMIVQCLWRPAKKPAVIQVAYNAAACGLAAAMAYSAGHFAGIAGLAVMLLASATVYFIANTLLVSIAISEVDHLSLQKAWVRWFQLSLPYYATGAVVASAVIVSNRYFGWVFTLLVLPLMYLEYFFYRMSIAEKTVETEARAQLGKRSTPSD